MLGIDRSANATSRGSAFALALALAVLPAAADPAPVPLLAKGEAPVDWWFAFKFNASKAFAGCVPREETEKSAPNDEIRQCIFGGEVRTKGAFGQQFAVASSKEPKLRRHGCGGATLNTPFGATVHPVYNGAFHYVLWNDQFYGDPKDVVCKSGQCTDRWGHSKGVLAWNDAGEGVVMQVTTPGWPRAGSKDFAKRSPNMGNTLGCISSSTNLLASQHFFALKLSKSDLIEVLKGLVNASVVTDRTKLQIVSTGGPPEVREQVARLGEKSAARKSPRSSSTKVILISKPSKLEVPPWQMVSALLANAGERTATWWASPFIDSTGSTTKIGCWDGQQLGAQPGKVTIAATGGWKDEEFKLNAPSNHAKIGVTTSGDKHYAIFGDLNQQGTIDPPRCDRSQNGRGGLFFVVENKDLFDGVTRLIDGKDAAPKK